MAQELKDTSLFSDANLVSYYRQESGALGTDSKGSNALTNNNTVGEAAGKFGGCSDFGTSNTNKSLTRTDQLGIAHNGNRTINIWVKIRTQPTTGNYICFVTQGYATNKKSYQIVYGNESGSMVVYADYLGNSGVGEYVAEYRADLGTSNWHMFTLVVEGTTMRLYHNGILSNSVTINHADGADTNMLDMTAIGRQSLSNVTRFASIYTDDCAIFSRALSATEIANLFDIGIKKIMGVSRNSIKKLNNLQIYNELLSTSLFASANLVSYWRMEGNSNDSKGSNNGVDTAITYNNSYGKFGQGALFNGSSSKILVDDAASLDINAGITIHAWVYYTGNYSDYATILTKHGGANSNYEIDLEVTSGNFIYYDGSGVISSGVKINQNEWTMVDITIPSGSNQAVSFYINGVLVATTGSTTLTPNNYKLSIGCSLGDTTPVQFFGGNIDEIALFNTNLSSDQISILFQSQVKKFMGVSNI